MTKEPYPIHWVRELVELARIHMLKGETDKAMDDLAKIEEELVAAMKIIIEVSERAGKPIPERDPLPSPPGLSLKQIRQVLETQRNSGAALK